MIDIKSINVEKIKSLLQTKPARIGIHLEGGVARIVRLAKSERGLVHLISYGAVEFNINSASVDQQREFQAEIKRVGGGLKRVAVNMEHPTLRVRRMVLAQMPEKDLIEAIRWNFREHIGVPIEQYVVGYVPLEAAMEGDKFSIVAYGVAQEAIDDYVNKFKRMGFKIVSLEPAASALLASFYVNGLLNDDSYHVCISFGETIANFVVMRREEMLFSRPLAGVSIDALRKQLARDFNVSGVDLRNALGLLFGREEPADEGMKDLDADAMRRLQATADRFFSELIIEIQRSIDAFCILYGVGHVDRIHVCGGGLTHPSLISRMENSLGKKSEIFNPFVNITAGGGGPKEVLEDAPLYAIAVGLAVS